MSSKRRRKSIFDLIDDLFKELREELEDFERGIWHRFSEIEVPEKESMKPIVYGFRITVGPDGIPRIEEFGNVRRAKRAKPKIVVSEEREPLVDIIESDKDIRVIVEMPGVDKDKISVKVIGARKLIVKGSNHDRKYYKEVELPADVKPESAKATYRNGVLEVKLEKKAREEEKGYEIKIE